MAYLPHLPWFRHGLAAWYLVEPGIDPQAVGAGHGHHQVGALRCATNSQHRIAVRKQPLRDRMEHFVEGCIPN